MSSFSFFGPIDDADIRRALKQLVERGIVEEERDPEGNTRYRVIPREEREC